MAIKPIGERVVIETLEAETKTAGGIIIPDNAQEKPQQGKVIAVGDGTAEVKLTLKAGDKVLYGKYAGTEITYEGKKYIIMKESDVLAIIN
ncbi:MAG: co-chaperone GroES [Chitinivibrionia bacterium]|nr:co-chaperone GroES [Chitinivibrionia bacterium]